MGRRRRRRNRPIFGNDPVPVRQQENAIKQRLKPYQTKFKAEVVEVGTGSNAGKAKIKRPGDEITVTLPQAEPAGSTAFFVENTIGFHFGQTVVAYRASDPNIKETLTVSTISEVDGTVGFTSPTTINFSAGDKVLATSGRGWNDVVGGDVKVGQKAWVMSDTGGVVVMGSASGEKIGSVKMWLGTADPGDGWMILNGRALSVSENEELFGLIGYSFGGSGNTFYLPDIRGRSPIGAGSVPGLTNWSVGEFGGAETVTLTVSQMPIHDHSGSTSSDTHQHGGSTGNAGGHDHGSTGSNGSHDHGYTGHVTQIVDVGVSSNSRDALSGATGKTTTNTGAHTHGISSIAGHDHSITSNTHSHSLSINNAGGGGSHPNIHPVMGINFIVKVR